MADGRPAVSAPPERYAEVVVRQREAIVVAQRRLVVRDRLVDRAFFEEHVADADDRRDALRIDAQRFGEEPQRLATVAAPKRLDAAPIERPRGVGLGFRPSTGKTAHDLEDRHSLMFYVDVLTLFPEMFAPFIGLSIAGRAHESGLVDVRLHHILDALEPGERADDAAYGGGPGMVMRLAPLARILDAIVAEAAPEERRTIVLTSPAGKPFVQADAQRFAQLDRLVIVCGRYEGVDERIRDLYPIEEISLGDFVVTGGEIAALAFIDATIRLLPGALNAASLEEESFVGGSLDYPSYTRPATFRGIDVPEVLLSGDHRKIAEWRREQARRRTASRRPDL